VPLEAKPAPGRKLLARRREESRLEAEEVLDGRPSTSSCARP
jgi:hypothetical protein